MSELFDGWTWWLEEAYVVHSPDEPEEWFKPKYITRTEEEVPQLTTDEEVDLMNKQIEATGGFDIDWPMFRCLFNYHPVDLNDKEMVDEPETNADLLKRLSQESLDNYNQENETKYEFVKPLYANFHLAAGVMLLITFQVKDPADNLTKEFQARVRYTFFDKTDFVFCRPKADPKAISTDGDSVGSAISTDGDSVGSAISTDEDSLGSAVSTDEDSVGVAQKYLMEPILE